MSCNNRRSFNYNHKPIEIISYEQSFLSVINAFEVTCTSIVAVSDVAEGSSEVTIINETIDLSSANWKGQLFMVSEGNGIVEISAAFSDGQVRFDYIHICSEAENIVAC